MDDDFVNVDNYVPIDVAIVNAQAKFQELASLILTGGSGSGKGWSRYLTLQKCPRAFQLSYLSGAREGSSPVMSGMTVGSGFHALAAAYYTGGRDLSLRFWDEIKNQNIDPLLSEEVERIFNGYLDHYDNVDYIIPLAVEQTTVWPNHNWSCRYDLIARIDDPPLGVMPGIWAIDHKCMAIFDEPTLNGWDLDGEITGEATFWAGSPMEEKYGPLQGVMLNIVGKQKKPQKFHRTWMNYSQARQERHLANLQYWDSQEANYKASFGKTDWPQSNGNCVGRYGKCNWYERCKDE